MHYFILRFVLGIGLSFPYSRALLADSKLENPTEVPVKFIQLAPPLDHKDAEISGMTWCQGQLVLLPQYPDFAARQVTGEKVIAGQAMLYSITHKQIDTYLNSQHPQPIKAKEIILDQGTAQTQVPGFEGYEAIACEDETIWLTAESKVPNPSVGGYIFTAQASLLGDSAVINLKDEAPLKTVSQSRLNNSGDEALLTYLGGLLSIHEANGSTHVRQAKATKIDLAKHQTSYYSFPAIPYRVTDATSVDPQNRFWVVNYQYQDDSQFSTDNDQIAAKYGLGISHQNEKNVERLLQLEIVDNEIRLLDQPPIQLELSNERGRNWEGIARFDSDQQSGFLLITDEYPKTYFGFIAAPTAHQYHNANHD